MRRRVLRGVGNCGDTEDNSYYTIQCRSGLVIGLECQELYRAMDRALDTQSLSLASPFLFLSPWTMVSSSPKQR